jgi:serine/threonine protein kinase
MSSVYFSYAPILANLLLIAKELMTHFDLNDYKIIEELGSGGMAKVYKAVQLKLDRLVVIKELSPTLSQDADFRERFSREAKISAKLSHPNIIQTYDVVVQESGSYLSIEYIENGDLSDLMQAPIEISTVLQLVKEMCNALDYAHLKGVIHRDVKTQNILVRANGSFVLADFGIAKARDMETQMTMVGSIIGSPKYMSPEQAQGHAVNFRSDFYSLGIVLFEILNGAVPFSGNSSVSLAVKHLSAPIPELPPEIRGLTPFFQKILAKSADDRYQNGQEVIEGFLQGLENINEGTVVFNFGKRENLSPSYLSTSKNKENSQYLTKLGGQVSKFKWIAVALALTISITSFWFYNKWNSALNQQIIQEQLSAAYQNLQSNKLAEALVLFNSVLEIDDSNGMAKGALQLTKEIYIDELLINLKQENYSIIEEKLNGLNGKFDDDSQIAEFTLQFEQAKFIKTTEQNVENKIDSIKVLLQQAQQKRAFIYPESDNAAEYLQELLKLQPNNEYAKQQLEIVNQEAITQIQQVIVSKEFLKSELLLDQYANYFGETLSFNNLEKLLKIQYQAEKEVKAEQELSKQKAVIALIELERQILTFDNKSTLPADIDVFYGNVNKHINLGGESTRLIDKVKLVLESQIRLIESQRLDLLTLKNIVELNEHPLIGNKFELKKEIEKFNNLLVQKRNDKKSAGIIYDELDRINKINKLTKGEIDTYQKNIIQLQNLQISDSSIILLKKRLSELTLQSIKTLIEQTHLANAKQLFNYSKQQNTILEELGLLGKTKAFENKLSNTEKAVVDASKKVIQVIKQAFDNNLFLPEIDNFIDQLHRALTNNLVAQNEIVKLTGTFYNSLLVKLKTLSELNHYQEFKLLYSASEHNFSKFPPNENTKKQIANLVKNTHLSNEKINKETIEIEQIIEQISFSLNKNQIEETLILLTTLKKKINQYQQANFDTVLADIEKQTLELLIVTIDNFIASKDKKSGEELFNQSHNLFGNNQQLVIRKNKLEEIKEKKIKLIGF